MTINNNSSNILAATNGSKGQDNLTINFIADQSVISQWGTDWQLTHPLISEYASNPLKVLACETAWAKAAISGASRCSGMLGIRS